MSPLFAAVTEATEEAIYNALFKASAVIGRGRAYEPIPLAPTLAILRGNPMKHTGLRHEPLSCHSERRAMTGSTPAARRAGR